MKVDWKSSEAKDILLNDLASGDISHTTSPREAWDDWYQYEEEFEGVEFSQFSRNMVSYRKKMMSDPKFVLENTTAATRKILQHLGNGTLPLHEKQMSARQAWDKLYRHEKAFNNVPLWHFEEKLRELRGKKQASILQMEELNFRREMSNHAEKLMKKQGRKSSSSGYYASYGY